MATGPEEESMSTVTAPPHAVLRRRAADLGAVPSQRIEHDIKALNPHPIMHPDTNAEQYGRIACGLPPNTQYP